MHVFSALLRPGQVVWDVGANVGFCTLLASRPVGPTGQVVAFEPLPGNVSLLKRHIQMSPLPNASTGIRPTAVAVQAAVIEHISR